MSEYKYKDDVKRVLFEEHRVASDPTVLNTAFNMRDELDYVYAQAAKADEYEEYKEKAEDYDRFIEDIKKYYSGVPLDASLHDLVARHYFNKGE